jgi:hypothetical protein
VDSNDADVSEIRRRMLEIRGGLATDVEGIRHHARQLADWRYYLRRFPWASVAAAAAVGYLVIPKRPRVMQADAETLAKLARDNHLVVQTVKDDRSRESTKGMLASLVTGLLMQFGKSYASGQVERFMKGEFAGRRGRETADQANGRRTN